MKINRQKIKNWLYARFARLHKARLAPLPAACSIVVAIILAIIIGIKLPMVVIALLVLAAVTLLWDAMGGPLGLS